VFVEDFQQIDRTYDRLLGALEVEPAAVLAAALDSACHENNRIETSVGPRGWPAPLAKRVEIHSGALRLFADYAVLSFSWKAIGASSLFPGLDADLEVAPFGTGQTQLTLRALYTPPGGIVGQRTDELLLHRMAKSTLRAVLIDVCSELERRLVASESPAHGSLAVPRADVNGSEHAAERRTGAARRTNKREGGNRS